MTKRYPAVLANDAVSLSVAPGEIHGLIGENGAGKSTLMKIAFGAVQPDAGTIRFNGAAVRIDSPATARALGIGMVFQHFALFESLTVTENVLLALADAKGADRERLAQRIRALGDRYGLSVDPLAPVYALSVGERQRVEIIRALLQSPKLLIMDEPTSVLTPAAVEGLFETLRRLASEGVSILYISHKLEEVRALCDRATVLRGGRVTGVCVPARESVASLSRLMIGAEPPRTERDATVPGEPVLEVRGLSLEPLERTGKALREVGLVVRRGEVIGIAGVSGNGQQELLAAIVGEDRRAPPQSVMLRGEAAGAASVGARRRRGLAYVPEERLGAATVPGLALDRNLLLSHADAALFRFGLIRDARLRERAGAIIRDNDVKAGGPGALASSLSGGNLQKFIVGREMARAPQLLVVAQPTWGVDVGAAARIRQALVALRDAGAALLVVSEELDELFEICDALYVIAGGRLSARMPIADASVESIGALMGGVDA
ncbi:MAG: ABC transporter ATP-binding protein [Lautropia sp.]